MRVCVSCGHARLINRPACYFVFFAFLASLGHRTCAPFGLSRSESHMQAGGRPGSNTPTSPSHPSRLWREDGRAATTEARRQSQDRPLHPRRHARSGDIRESEELSHAFCVAPSWLCTLTPSLGRNKVSPLRLNLPVGGGKVTQQRTVAAAPGWI